MIGTYDRAVVQQAAVGRWRQILPSLGNVPADSLVSHEIPCPMCGGNTRWRVYDDFNETGGCRCNQCGNWSSGFDYLAFRLGVSVAAAIDTVGEHLGCEQRESRRNGSVASSRRKTPKRSSSGADHEAEAVPLSPMQEERNVIRQQLERVTSQRKSVMQAGEDFQRLDSEIQRLKIDLCSLRWLAQELGVTVQSLESLGVSYDIKLRCWKSPERDAQQNILCVSRRYEDGLKEVNKGGRRGLVYELNWQSKLGPILIVEGLSDTAAGISLGLPTIGRPSCKLPKTLLPELVAMLKTVPSDRQIIVVGDNDRNAQGRDGAIQTATSLRKELGRPVGWALPPEGVKDLRAWLRSNPDSSGAEFLDSLAITSTSLIKSNDRTLRNYHEVGEEKVPLPLHEIIAQVNRLNDQWPRVCGDRLFVRDTESGIRWIDNVAQLSAFFSCGVADPPTFLKKAGFVQENTLLEALRQSQDRYESIEFTPHEPRFPDRFYACEDVKSGTGERLEWLLSRFQPATTADAELIKALFLTCLWGGVPGSRPAFVISAPDRGAGKTTLAEICGELAGGIIDVSANDDIDRLKARMLSPEGRRKRVALIDNAKTRKLSWAELEALITCQTISGRANYIGEASRPNTLLWCITINGVALSRDMAQRSVVIQLQIPRYSGGWREETMAYVRANRNGILNDLITTLKGAKSNLPKYSRWGAWEKDVLALLLNPTELQEVIRARQNESDVDDEESLMISDEFESQLQDLDYDTGVDVVFIPSKVAAEWYKKATTERDVTHVKASRILREKIRSGLLKNLREPTRNDCGSRGLVWCRGNCLPVGELHTDVEERIEQRAILSSYNGKGFR